MCDTITQYMKDQLFCGIAFNVHDSSVSFAIGNHVVLVLEAERIFRKKKIGCAKNEMEYLISIGLSYLGKRPEDVSYWSITTLNNPLLTKDDIINPLTQELRKPYWKKVEIMGLKPEALIVNHHLSHATSYLLSPFQKAIIITCDGGGDYDARLGFGECFAVYRGYRHIIERQAVEIQKLITGKTYGSCATFIYNTMPCEGKLMALSAFGEVRQDYLDLFKKIYRDLETVDYPIGGKILKKAFPNLRGAASEQTPSKDARDFCATLQSFFTKRRLENTQEVIGKFYKKGDNFVLAGGTALNLDLNTSILNKFPHMQHFIPPCCDDTGQSLGALCLLISEVLKVRPNVNLPYLGMGENEIKCDSDSIDKVVDVLLKNGIAIIHNGRAEIGPRALGHRSLLIRPDSLEVKRKLSEGVKQRESYRPLAPVVLEEKVNEYFIGPATSPFMLYKYDVLHSAREQIKGGIHYDGSARVQSINRKVNPFLYDLIKKFGDKTGTYVLLNTSLNLKGDPIANTIDDTLEIYNKIRGPKVLVHNGTIQFPDSILF